MAIPAKRNKAAVLCVATVLCINLLLFFTKLFIGLSANSISIYSDAINNLFDSVGALLTVCFISFLNNSSFADKCEQLLTFIISCLICFTGGYFLYSSTERLMYPTPVWYTTKYFVVLCITSAVKLMLFIILRRVAVKNNSAVVKLISTDSLLDFFIGCTTVLTLLLSAGGKYAADAVCGILISIIILISAIKSAVTAVKMLINYVSKEKREQIKNGLCKNNCVKHIQSLKFVSNNICIATIELKSDAEDTIAQALQNIKSETNITVFIERE